MNVKDNDFLEGAADLHVHSAPDIVPRRFDDIDLAREAARAGLGALLIKSHQASTVERAILVSRVVPEIRVFGGLVLNDAVGGFNVEAVRVALKLGARQIWMPTQSARNHRRQHGLPGGLTVMEEPGQLCAAVREIVKLIADAGAILGTGHLSPEEGVPLIHHARRCGVRSVLVTHPEWAATAYPIGLQNRLAAEGGVFFERCFVSTTHRGGHVPIKSIADAIAQVGVTTTVLATDLGQPDTPPPAEGLRLYAEQLWNFGFSQDDLRAMMVENPRRLLAL